MDLLRLDGVCTVSLCRLLPGCRILGADDVRVRSLAIDSRHLQAGDLFVALPGSRRNGRQYVPEAIRRGAAAVMTTDRLADLPVPVVVVPDVHHALAELCWALAGSPQRRLKLIGITGTNGKTTTTYLVHAILSQCGPAGMSGTIVRYDGSHYRPSGLTTPPLTALADLLAAMVEHGCWAAVMEVSSHALVQQRCAGLLFDVAAFLNLGHDHLDYHRSLESYADAKRRLFEQLAPRGRAVAWAGDPHAKQVTEPAADRCWTFDLDNPADVRGTIASMDRTGTVLRIDLPGGSLTCHLKLIGHHNARNALAAAAAAAALGCSPGDIKRGLEQVHCVPGRLERVGPAAGPAVYVDYAHTPDALATALGALRQTMSQQGRLIVVFGAGGDRDRQKRPKMGAVASRLADVVIITDDNPRTEDPALIVGDILRGCTNPAAAVVQRNRARAIELALELAHPDDVVLIAGKGHEQYQIIGSQRLPFDDREVVHEWFRRHMTRPGGWQQATA